MTASIMNARIVASLALAILVVPVATARAQSPGSSRSKRVPANAQTLARLNAEFDKAAKIAYDARSAGRLDEAVELYTKALQIRPKWSEGWWYLGVIFYEKDLYVQARDAFRNLTSLEVNRGPAWGMLGLCEFQTREYERAVISLQRGRSVGLENNQELESVVRYHTALLYIRFEQFEIAFDVLKEFLKAGIDSQKVVEAFGLTMLRMPFLPSEIPADQREEVLLAGRAGLNMGARRTDEARSAFDSLLARYPNAPNVHYAFGVFLMNQDADAALREFRRELEISPSHYPAMVQMAFEYLKRGDHTVALPLAEKSVELAPKMYAARNVLGRVLLQLGQIDRAVKELEEGVRLAPLSAEMHFALARAYTRIGRKADAARERELFKRLQDEFEARSSLRPADQANGNQPNAKP